MMSVVTSLSEPLAFAVFSGARAANRAVDALVEAGFEDEHIFVLARGDDEAEWVKVQFRSGVRTGMQWGALLGIVVGACINYAGAASSPMLVREVITGASIGLPLGMMTGLVAGLGHWSHIAEFPSRGYQSRPILVGVDLTAERHEAAARGALNKVGASAVEVCDKEQAEARIQATSQA